MTDFYQRDPNDGDPVTQRTEAYLSYDSENLHVLFVCEDEPGKIRARMSKREDISNDDQVVIYLDTFFDRRRAFVFATNPLGIQRDGVRTEGQGTDFDFDTLWYSEGRLTANGFVVRITIPFKSLRFPRSQRQVWGLALGRVIRRRNEKSFWPHITRRVEGFVSQLGTLEGLSDISPGRNMEFIPYATFARARLRDAASDEFSYINQEDRQAGLDGKFVFRDSLSLDLTVNPDFSQVESDDPQVTVNQRFEVFFPEKRPFFIENADFFETPIRLFFSRRIADPTVGARLTGRMGGWRIGVLGIDDQAPGARQPPTAPFRGNRSRNSVFRLQRDVGRQSNVGALFTSRVFGSGLNRVFGLDTRLKLSPNWVFTGQIAQSQTQTLEGVRLSDPAYRADISYSSRNLNYESKYSDLGKDFRAQLGFVRRVDFRETEHFVSYFWYPENGSVLDFGTSLSTELNWDRQGRMQDWSVNASFQIDFSGPTGIQISRFEAFTLYEQLEFRSGRTDVSFFTGWLKWLEIFGSYGWGTGINFSPALGLAPHLADSVDASFGLTLRPVPQLQFEQSYVFSHLGTLPDSILPEMEAPVAIFDNNIVRSKLNWQFTRELSVRAIFDYSRLRPNTSFFDAEPFKEFRTDILVTYLLNPGTAFYIGYTDRYENLSFGTETYPGLSYAGLPLTSTARQFFVKLSYLFRF